MKIKMIEIIKSIRSCLLENENKPTSIKEIHSKLNGAVSMADIHYGVRVMTERRNASRVKQGTYVLTDSSKPVEAYISTDKKKVKKPNNNIVTLQEKIKEWDEEEKKIDLQELCEKLQNALAKSYVDCDLLEATVAEQKVIIKYLESRNRYESNPV